MFKAITFSCLLHFVLFLMLQVSIADSYAKYTGGSPYGNVGSVQIYSYLDLDASSTSDFSNQTPLPANNISTPTNEIQQNPTPNTNTLDTSLLNTNTLKAESNTFLYAFSL